MNRVSFHNKGHSCAFYENITRMSIMHIGTDIILWLSIQTTLHVPCRSDLRFPYKRSYSQESEFKSMV